MNVDSGARVLDPLSRAAVIAALRRGEKIAAVRQYRLATGAGLAEAKRAVEMLGEQNGIPGTGDRIANVSFPFGTLLLVILAVALGVWTYARYAPSSR